MQPVGILDVYSIILTLFALVRSPGYSTVIAHNSSLSSGACVEAGRQGHCANVPSLASRDMRANYVRTYAYAAVQLRSTHRPTKRLALKLGQTI